MKLVELKEADFTPEQLKMLTEDLGEIETVKIEEEIQRVDNILEQLNG